VARTWLTVTVELVEGRGYRFWPRPGRVFAAARTHTFGQFATAIDVSFGRWDLSHPWQFELADRVSVAPGRALGEDAKLSRLAAGEEFVYQFDVEDAWLHICRVAAARIDPLEALGDVPPEPTPYDGWGILPDQYLRRFADDDGGTPDPVDQRNHDLPPLRPGWGPGAEAAVESAGERQAPR
jgi:hypothetical protein